MKSIKTKITVSFSIVSIGLIIFLAITSYFISYSAIENESKAKILMAAEKYS